MSDGRRTDPDPGPTGAFPPGELTAAHPAPGLAPTADGAPAAPGGSVPGVPPELAHHPRYRVLELLGSGGMGAVYRAEHLLMERPVALKVIHRGLLANPATVERFRREVKAAAKLSHPNIVTAHDADQAGDVHFLVMEYVEGTSLARLVAERGPLPVARACDFVRQAALGLQHAHERGMVHRDIKPANLMLTPAGQVKVLDFGLARFALERASTPDRPTPDGSPGSLTLAGSVMGTPDYIAPEQATDAHAADIRADIYSLGCTLYDLLAGHPPFPDGTALEKVRAHGKRKPRPLTEVRKDVPAALARVVDRMLAKDPAGRYQTPAEAAQALTRFTDHAARQRRRRWVTAVTIAATVVAAFLGQAFSGYGINPLRWWSGPGRAARPALAAGEVRRFTGHTGSVKSVAFAPNGRFVLSGSGYPTYDNTARVWDVDTGRELVCFRGHRSPVYSVAVSPDSRFALTGSGDRTACLWEVATGKELLRLEGHGGPVTGLAFAPDGRRAVSACADKILRLWDLDTGKPLRRFTGHTGEVLGVAFAPDGRHILSGSRDGTLRLWDADTGQTVQTFSAFGEQVSGVALSPDGRLALSASDGVRLWDVAAGRVVAHFEWPGGHMESVAFSPDGRRVLGAGVDSVVRLWDVDTTRLLASFPGHTRGAWSVAFSPDGKLGLSGGGDGTVRLWQLPAPEAGPGR